RDWLHNRQLARAIADIGMHEFKRRLRDQVALSGAMLMEANPWLPSSKTCSGCGTVVKNLPRFVWEWTDGTCGTHHDRDVNAAKILSAWCSRGRVAPEVMPVETGPAVERRRAGIRAFSR
ncbi:MAG: hypothetical protein C0184_13415, partial [Chloroflexus aggregans]